MIFKTLGRTREKVPAIGMGTWQLDTNSETLAALKKGLELGDNFIDTAEIYGTEKLVGEAIMRRDDIFIASKVWPSHFDYDNVIKACDASLKRLGVKCIDLYQLHWPNYTIPIEETMSAMEHLQKEGKIRHIGVSNFSVKEFQEAQACLSHSDIVSNQVEYSIIMREPEEDGVLDFCRRERVTLIAYSPFGSGALFNAKRKPFLDALAAFGNKNGLTPAQAALAWLISKEPVVAIPKASTEKHVLENIAAMDHGLKIEGIDEIERISGRFRKLHRKPLASRTFVRKVLKHTKFWHGYAEKKLGKKND
ncbi:MAG: aldo/keto reductase [Candidatus Micrarchaeales archaeon]|nr:aldo/keto reductase [Candidatus Micrarchaeales archaeon]